MGEENTNKYKERKRQTIYLDSILLDIFVPTEIKLCIQCVEISKENFYFLTLQKYDIRSSIQWRLSQSQPELNLIKGLGHQRVCFLNCYYIILSGSRHDSR